MTKKDEEKLNKELAELESFDESDQEQEFNDRQQELDWITEQLVEMDSANYRKFMRSIKHARKASFYRGGMSSNA